MLRWGVDTVEINQNASAPEKPEGCSEFEDLAMPLFDSLYNFAHWLVRNREDAEDLVQETYLKAFRSFDSFQPGTNLRAWMFRILKNTSSSAYSKLARISTVPVECEDDFPMPETSVNPESLLMGHFVVEDLWRAIESLPLNFREVLLLRETEDASYREISEILSIPVGTVMSRLARARMMLRESLTSAQGKQPLVSLAISQTQGQA